VSWHKRALYYNQHMRKLSSHSNTNSKIVTFRPGPELHAAMERLHERDGISPSEMLRRALTAWLTEKGILQPAPRKRSLKGAA